MSKFKTTVVKADSSPESIKRIHAIHRFRESTGKSETCVLSGTVDEKVAQFEEFFGIKWLGTAAATYSELRKSDTPFVPLFGEYEITSMMNPATTKAKEAIDKLTELACQYLREDKLIKEKKKLLEVRATMKEQETIPV